MVNASQGNILSRKDLVKFLNEHLTPHLFSDYGPNGLQVQGKDQIKKICFAVSASKESITKTIELGADALIVHHGIFWKHQGAKTVTGPFAERLIPLIKNDVNLIAYHLPLDAHIELGNAASLAHQLGMINLQPIGDYHGMPLGVKGQFSEGKIKPKILLEKLKKVLNREVIHADATETTEIDWLAIITGGANNEWSLALKEKCQAYLTGEISEYNYFDAIESGIHYFAGGHNATERFGVQSLMNIISKQYQCECLFLDVHNPV